MPVKAAVLWKANTPLEIVDLVHWGAHDQSASPPGNSHGLIGDPLEIHA